MQHPPLRQRRKGVVTLTYYRICLPALQKLPVILANFHFHTQCESQNQRSHQGAPRTGKFGMFGVVPTETNKQFWEELAEPNRRTNEALVGIWRLIFSASEETGA